LYHRPHHQCPNDCRYRRYQEQLSDTELAAVMTYTRNAWGNKTGEVIQPADFVNARAGKFPEGGGAKSAQGAPADAKPAAEQASAGAQGAAS
jgi:cytochrome c oxidase subunit 2